MRALPDLPRPRLRMTPAPRAPDIPPTLGGAPVIVLVRPQLGENIGKAARAMLNFGLAELRLVAPRDGWPNPAAGPAAAGADSVLAEARLFPTLAEAVSDCAHVYATTVRKRGVTKPVLTPEAAARAIHQAPGRAALVFGPERSGLDTEEVALARAIVTIPVNPAFASLNLAQAVLLTGYEWFMAHYGEVMPFALPERSPPAPRAMVLAFYNYLEEALAASGFFRPPGKVKVMRRNLYNIFHRMQLTEQDVRTLRGVVVRLVEGKRGTASSPEDEV